MSDPQPPRVADPADLQRRRAAIAGRLFGARPRSAGTIGRYTVVRRLGAGGMAVVYAAYDESLDRKVALKLLHGVDADAEHKSRLAREAKAMARLSHVNVATVFETGTHEGGDGEPHPFIAMEFVDGENLRRWLETPRPVDEVLDVIAQAGLGLAAAHDASLVHRDLKPENVMVRNDGVVKVVDFGVAAMRGRALGPEDSLAAPAAGVGPELTTATVAGTPAYMAPEQLRGTPADARSDQYSFCVTAYEALTGLRPFTGDSVRELLDAMAKPSFAERPDVPRPILEALQRGLAYEPGARFESMPALLRALRPPAPHARRTRTVVVTLGAGIGLGALGLWLGGTLGESCGQLGSGVADVWEPTRAAALEKRFVAVTQPPFLAETWARVRTRLDALAKADADARQRLCTVAGAAALRQSPQATCLEGVRTEVDAALEGLEAADRIGLERAVDLVAGVTDPGHCLDADVALTTDAETPRAVAIAMARGRAKLATADLEGARAVAAEAVSGLGNGATPRARAQAHHLAAEVALQAADYDACAEQLQRADAVLVGQTAPDLRAMLSITRLGMMVAKHSPDAKGFAAGLVQMIVPGTLPARADARLAVLRASLSLDAGDLETAAAAAELAELAGAGLPPRARGEAVDLVARIHLAAGRYERALVAAERALALRREAYGETHPEVAASLGTAGAISLRLGRWAAARTMLTAARDTYEAAYGSEHPDLARTRANLGSALRELSLNDDALTEYEAARASFERLHGTNDARVAAVLLNESALRHEMGQFVTAREGYARVLAIQRARFDDDHPHVLAARANLGQLQADLGEADAADTMADVLARRRKSLGSEHTDVAKAALELGHVRLAAGDADAAVTLYQEALKIDRAAFGGDHFRVAEDLASLATALQAMNRAGEAAAAVAEAREIMSRVPSAEARTGDQRSYLGHLREAGRSGARAEQLEARIAILAPQ
ncbi:MAG: serine/threonine-protein kinase [Myxococcota bacterium]